MEAFQLCEEFTSLQCHGHICQGLRGFFVGAGFRAATWQMVPLTAKTLLRIIGWFLLLVYMYIYVCMYRCIDVYMYICIDVYMYRCIDVYICMYVYMYICIYVYMYVCTYVRTYLPTYLPTYIHTYIYSSCSDQCNYLHRDDARKMFSSLWT